MVDSKKPQSDITTTSDPRCMVAIEGKRELDPNLYERLKQMILDNPHFDQAKKPLLEATIPLPDHFDKAVHGGFRRGELVTYSGSMFRLPRPIPREDMMLINLETGKFTDAGREQALTIVRSKAREMGVTEAAMQAIYDSESFYGAQRAGKTTLIDEFRFTKGVAHYPMASKRVGHHLSASTKRAATKPQLQLGKFRKIR